MMTGSILFLVGLLLPISSGYFLIITSRKYVLHIIVLVGFVVRSVGSLFKILHWTGAEEILLISYAGFALGGFLLIWTGLRNPTGKMLHYQLVVGSLILLMVLNAIFPTNNFGDVARYLPYPAAGLSATILLNGTYVHQGEKNMLKMYFIVAIIAVIVDLMRLF